MNTTANAATTATITASNKYGNSTSFVFTFRLNIPVPTETTIPAMTLSNGVTNINLASYFTYATLYSATSPNANVLVTGSNLAVTAANRGTTYFVNMTGSNSSGSISQSVSVKEAVNYVPVAGVSAVYTGETLSNNGIWYDMLGSTNNATVVGTVTTQSNINGKKCILGGTSANITFPATILPSTYTLFHVTRYNGPNQARIITSSDGANWLSGFHGSIAARTYHNNWITNTADPGFNPSGSNWILSTDQNSLYRANGANLTVAAGGTPSYCRLGVNTFGSEVSDWAVAYLAVYPTTLSATDINTIEASLSQIYDIPLLTGSSISIPTLTNNTYSTNISQLFSSNVTSYGLENPVGSATLTGSNLQVVGAYRGSSYTIGIRGYSPSGSMTIYRSVVTESANLVNTIGMMVYDTSDDGLGLAGSFPGFCVYSAGQK